MITHSINKGLDVRLAGKPEAKLGDAPEPQIVAVLPSDFPGIKPKLLVAEGDAVKTGSPLFYDKLNPDTKFVSPGTGTVKAIIRGERRALLRVEVELAASDSYAEESLIKDLSSTGREDLIVALRGAGLWPLFLQRPVGKLADPAAMPVAIFVNGMDTEPNAADPAFAANGKGAELQVGFDALKRLTDGKVYLSLRAGQSAAEFGGLSGVEVHGFSGPHPSGLTGTHIDAIAPLKAGQVAWTLRAQDVAQIGHWIKNGQYPSHRVVAVSGSSATTRQYYKVRQGATISTLCGNAGSDVRIVNGSALSGAAVAADGYLGHYANTVTILPEGEGKRDLFGWALPQFGKLSASRAVWSWLMPKKEYVVDTRLNGGARPIVNIGSWDSISPIDIQLSYLIRSIQANDIEEALSLGLLELIEEDVALATFVDHCKLDVGQVIRQGLDLYEREG